MIEIQPRWTVITGSTGGIGDEIVKILANRGSALILINRSEEKANQQRNAILSMHSDLMIESVTADFMDVGQINKAIQHINELPGRIDALYNNSGVLTGEKLLSTQGFESHFAVNTLAPFILIRDLARKMERPAGESPAMIINFSSSAISRLKTLNLETLANPAEVGGLMTTYAQSKLAVTAIVSALADPLKAKNILIRAIDPGATKSSMTTGGNSGMPKIIAWLAPFVFSPANKQALKIVDSGLPDSHGGRTGIYIANRKERKMPALAADTVIHTTLLSMLEKMSRI